MFSFRLVHKVRHARWRLLRAAARHGYCWLILLRPPLTRCIGRT
nr:MAG: hypothetical protein [Molluscum contagiosum virus]